MPAANWSVDRTLRNRGAAMEWVGLQGSVPPAVRAAVVALIDALPPDREDCTVKVSTSGHVGDWADWSAMPVASAVHGEASPQQRVQPKPTGFFSLWVGYSNQPADA